MHLEGTHSTLKFALGSPALAVRKDPTSCKRGPTRGILSSLLSDEEKKSLLNRVPRLGSPHSVWFSLENC